MKRDQSYFEQNYKKGTCDKHYAINLHFDSLLCCTYTKISSSWHFCICFQVFMKFPSLIKGAVKT